jgi:hypothetical protein
LKGERITPKALDEQGRCCGRKPLHYKTARGMKERADPHRFCTRCDAEFSMDGQQRANWAWTREGAEFVRT